MSDKTITVVTRFVRLSSDGRGWICSWSCPHPHFKYKTKKCGHKGTYDFFMTSRALVHCALCCQELELLKPSEVTP